MNSPSDIPSHGGKRAGAGRPVGSRSTAADWRVRREAAVAQLRELELAERRGKLIDVETAIAGWTKRIAAMRARLLSIPAKVAGPLANARTATECAAILEDEIHQALHEVAGDGTGKR